MSRAGAQVSVLVPVRDQAAFLPRALGSLVETGGVTWEALVLDDGSGDDVAGAVAGVIGVAAGAPAVRVLRWPTGRGLGATLNAGLDAATAPVVAYLPADDVWDPDHLVALLAVLADPEVTMAVSGVRHHGTAASRDAPPGVGVQLVQVAHRRTGARWVERAELESDDLHRLMWDALAPPEHRGLTGRVTCEWTDHPGQRHKAIRESFDGGLNVFRRRYGVREPLRLHSTDSGTVDEVERYRRFRERTYPPSADGLRVLLAGELAFNPERVLALAERGHRLHGLWTDDPLGDSTVGPLPFGHVPDLPRAGWREAVRALRPDVVYALLNWRAVPLAHAVLRAFPDLPMVWHFKEAPQRALARGQWPLLADLVCGAHTTLVATVEERDWFLAALPGRLDPARIGVLDGDLPVRSWFTSAPSGKLSDLDGQLHAAVVGRPLGLDAELLVALAAHGVHTHLYGPVDSPGPGGAWRSVWREAVAAAPAHVHRHPAVGPGDWVRELSRHDAAWLHRFGSGNDGQIRRATWDDLNSPARLPVVLGAGLPALVQANPGHRVAVERILAEAGAGLFYRAGAPGDVAAEVAELLRAEASTRAGSRSALAAREQHVIEAHVDRLDAVLRQAAGSLQVRPSSTSNDQGRTTPYPPPG